MSAIRGEKVVALLLAALAGCASLAPVGQPFESAQGYGYRTSAGRVTLPPSYVMALPFSRHGIAAVVDDAGWAIIDRRGTVLLRPVVVDNGPDPFSESLARFAADGKVGFFDRHGRTVIPARYDWAAPFHEGRAAFCQGCRVAGEGEYHTVQGGLWGYLDRRGREVVAARFAAAGDFAHGQAAVVLEGRHVAVDRSGRPRPVAAD